MARRAKFSAGELGVLVRKLIRNLRLKRGLIIVKNSWGCKKQNRFKSLDVISLKAIVMSNDLISDKIISLLCLFWANFMIREAFKRIIGMLEDQIFTHSERLNKSSIFFPNTVSTKIILSKLKRLLPYLVSY